MQPLKNLRRHNSRMTSMSDLLSSYLQSNRMVPSINSFQTLRNDCYVHYKTEIDLISSRWFKDFQQKEIIEYVNQSERNQKYENMLYQHK